MTLTALPGIYGTPLPELVSIPADAIQLSPLIPGSQPLDALPEGSLSELIMHAAPGTIERRYAMAHGLRALLPGAPFTILAPKNKGGTRLKKELQSFGCVAEDTPGQHYRTCTGVRPAVLANIDSAIDEGAPRLLPDIGLWSQPGVFSWNRIDAGSALLMQFVPPLTGKGADFGAGIGYLAREVLASPAVTHLAVIDVDQRAIAACKQNLDDARITLHWADLRDPSFTLSNLDFVVMNPPFHDGGTEDRALGHAFIRQAHKALKPGGVCWLVANRHLPYEEVLQPLFSELILHTQVEGYKIYEARK